MAATLQGQQQQPLQKTLASLLHRLNVVQHNAFLFVARNAKDGSQIGLTTGRIIVVRAPPAHPW